MTTHTHRLTSQTAASVRTQIAAPPCAAHPPRTIDVARCAPPVAARILGLRRFRWAGRDLLVRWAVMERSEHSPSPLTRAPPPGSPFTPACPTPTPHPPSFAHALHTLPPPAQEYSGAGQALDGIPAEIAAARRAAKSADTYFAMRPPSGHGAAAEAAGAVRSLARAWEDRFGNAAQVHRRAPAAAAAAAAICGAAWQLGGGSVWAPVLATAIAVGAAYAWAQDEAPARIDVEL